MVEVLVVGPPLRTESAPPMFVTAPVDEASLVAVWCVQLAPVIEYVSPGAMGASGTSDHNDSSGTNACDKVANDVRCASHDVWSSSRPPSERTAQMVCNFVKSRLGWRYLALVATDQEN